MNKLSVALGTALVCLAASSAWAGGAPDSNPYDNNPYDSSMDYSTGMDSSMDYSSGMPSGFNMPVNPNMLANNYAGGNMMPNTMPNNTGMMGGGMGMMPNTGMMGGGMGMMPMMGGMMGGGMGMMPNTGMMGGSYPSSGSSSSLMPTVDLGRVVSQGVQGLPQQQQQYGAMTMANQNLNQLNQGMSNGMSPIYQMRNNIRNQIMGNRISDISRMGQRMFMPMVQPGAIQSMISQIQPWNFPSRFQNAMMPNMAPYVSQSIIPRQMAYMQQGIMNNPNFPFPRSGSGGYGNDYGMGMSGGMGSSMPYNNGMGMGMPMQQQYGGMMGGYQGY
jgi:hypothetical protein